MDPQRLEQNKIKTFTWHLIKCAKISKLVNNQARIQRSKIIHFSIMEALIGAFSQQKNVLYKTYLHTPKNTCIIIHIWLLQGM